MQVEQQQRICIRIESSLESDLQTEKTSETKPSLSPKANAPMRKRAAYTYHQISNEDRNELVRRVLIEKDTLAQASRDLKINYSTAKTIMRTYRLFKRVDKVPHTMRFRPQCKKSEKADTLKREAKSEEVEKKISKQQAQMKPEACVQSPPFLMSAQNMTNHLQLRDTLFQLSQQLTMFEAQKAREQLLAQQESLRVLLAIQSLNSQNLVLNGLPVDNNQYYYSHLHHLQSFFGHGPYSN